MDSTVKNSSVELTILIPCLNEAETIGICISKALSYLETSNITGEVLVADNGSTDNSREIASNLGARVVPVPQRGYGAALRGGIAAAQGRYIIMGDADDSYDFTSLQPFVDKLREGAQLVMGNRFAGGIEEGAMPFLHRYLGNPVLSFLGRLFFGVPVGDFHCGLRGFQTESIRALHLKTSGMEFASEMVVKAALHKLRICEVPTRLAKDGRSHPPHLRTWRDGWRHLCFLLALTPTWLFIYPGLFFGLLGIVGVGALLTGPAHILNITLDIKSFIFSCLSLLIGVQSLTLGVIVHEYALMAGLLPRDRSIPLPKELSRDRVALLAGAFGALGLLLGLVCIGGWAMAGFGEMQSGLFDRLAVLSLTCFAGGVQLFHAAFVVEVIQKPRAASHRIESARLCTTQDMPGKPGI